MSSPESFREPNSNPLGRGGAGEQVLPAPSTAGATGWPRPCLMLPGFFPGGVSAGTDVRSVGGEHLGRVHLW
jgi:hypothetical protein